MLGVAKLGTPSFFIASSVIQRAMVMGTSLVALRWVQPEQLGAWQFALLLEQLFFALRLGVPNAVNRQVPLLLGKGDLAGAAKCLSAGLAFMLIVGALLGTAAATLACFWSGATQADRAALLALAASAPLNMLVNLLEGTIRGSSVLRRLAWFNLGLAAFGVASIVLPAQFGFEGFLWRLVFVAGVQVVVLVSIMPIPVRFGFNLQHLQHLRELVGIGLQLYVWNYLSALSANLLPWYVLTVGGTALLGIYGPANSLLSALALVPAAFCSYLGPTQNFALGQGRSRKELLHRIRRHFLASLGLTTLGAVACGLLLPLFVQIWLPSYKLINEVIWLVVAIGCIRCYVVVQTLIGTFVDWWLIRISLLGLWAVRLGAVATLIFSRQVELLSIFWAWLAGEALYLGLLLWQLETYSGRFNIEVHSS